MEEGISLPGLSEPYRTVSSTADPAEVWVLVFRVKGLELGYSASPGAMLLRPTGHQTPVAALLTRVAWLELQDHVYLFTVMRCQWL